ncbi:MAG: hypothetical protein RIQ60_2273 [Pseudomonadota bacterium]
MSTLNPLIECRQVLVDQPSAPARRIDAVHKGQRADVLRAALAHARRPRDVILR